MNASPILPEELELQRCEEEDQRLARELAEARERPKQIAREKLDRENTMPPLDRVEELTRLKRHEQEIASRAKARNLQKKQKLSVLLLLTLIAAAAALIAWGLRLMNG